MICTPKVRQTEGVYIKNLGSFFDFVAKTWLKFKCAYKNKRIKVAKSQIKHIFILLCGEGSLPFPASGSPTARFAVANVNDGTFGFVTDFVLRLCRVLLPRTSANKKDRFHLSFLLVESLPKWSNLN